MHRRDILLGSLGLALSGAATPSTDNVQQAGQKRFALILANQTYEKNPLPNIDNDASLMAKTLAGLGFTVSTLMNGTRSTMRTKLKELKDNLAANPGGIGFVYYSGHGVQVDSENYLVPVNNAALTSEADVKEDCLSLSYVLEMSKGTQAKAYITVLDACRDNPFLGQKGDGNKGLAVVGRTLDASTLVAFAASPGETASATLGGGNSIYTAELVKQMQTPNLSLQEVFQSTRSAVRTKSSNKQRPREDNGLEEQIFLNGRGVAGVNPNPNPGVEAPAGSVPTSIRLELTGVPAGANVTVDGAKLSGNVFTDDIVEKAKSLEVAVVATGYKPYVHTVVISRGGTVNHAIMLEATTVTDILKSRKFTIKLDSGLEIEELSVGSGKEARAGNKITLHYELWLTDGKRADSTKDRKMPVTFKLASGQVIPGLDEGATGMRVGGKRLLLIPPKIAYGKKGLGKVIPSDATLIFDVELIDLVT